MTAKNLLIIFVKNPILGHCKTRLAKGIGAENALSVYKQLLAHTHDIAIQETANKAVFYSQEISQGDLWEEALFEKKVQAQGDLGQKMEAAFKWGFSEGYERIVLIGSDLIDLSLSDINTAFSALNTHKTVFGPAQDGGYYLIGQSVMQPSLFENIPWSTPIVLQESTKKLKAKEVALLDIKNDIDTLDDLRDHAIFKPFIPSK